MVTILWFKPLLCAQSNKPCIINFLVKNLLTNLKIRRLFGLVKLPHCLLMLILCGWIMNKVKPLKAKQTAALRLLAQGESHKFVAETLRVSQMTIYRWGNLPAFQTQLKTINASETGLEVTARRLSAAALTAVETCQEVMCNMLEPVELRLKAAQIALRAMPSNHAAIEKALLHRWSDFELSRRFEGGSTYDSAGREIQKYYASPKVRSESGGIMV